MCKPYDYDLRIKAMELIENGMPITEVKRLLNISRDTLHNWKNLKASTGNVLARKPGGAGIEPKIKDLEKFKDFVNTHSDKTQTELAQLWPEPIAQTTIGRYLRKIKYTFKKRPMAIVKEMKKQEPFLKKKSKH